MSQWRPYKARPAPTTPLGRSFETGTQSYELLAGFNATIDYLDSIGGFAAIAPYERALGQRFLDGLSGAVTVYGRPGMDGRVPTFLVNVDGVAAEEVASRLADAQIGVWRTTRGTHLACTRGSVTPTSRSGSASSTTTRRTRSTGLTGALNGLRLSATSPAGCPATRLPRRGSRRACPG